MSESEAPGSAEFVVGSKPPGATEFTVRALIAGMVVALIMGASYPYVVLKLGFGPNVSVVAAFFGYLFLGILFKSFNRWENNIVQTAGTSAAQTAFMCIILAAFDLVSQNPKLDYPVPQALDPNVVQWLTHLPTQTQDWFFWLTNKHAVGLDPEIFGWLTDYYFSPTTFQSFLWLTCASVLGLLLAVPLRRHYIVDEKLTFADGVAAAETIVVLDARGDEAKRAARALFLATLVSAVFWFLTTKWSGELFGVAELNAECNLEYHGVLPENVLPTMFGLTWATAGAGFAVSLLALGSGMIVGNRINVSMAVGAVIAWVIGPHLLTSNGIIPFHTDPLACNVPVEAPGYPVRGNILLWMMWPGTGMLVAAGLTALFLKWRALARTFSTLSSKSIDVAEFPLKWVGIGVVATTIGLLAIQQAFFDVSLWTTLVAALLSVPLMLVGLRVLGETNWGPISQLTNMMQVIFAALVPKNITANLAASGTTGTIATQSEAIMQDYKAGHIIGSTPRYLTYSQLLAAPIGALAVAISYPAFRDLYGVGDGGLSAPGSRRIAGFAEVLAEGFDKLPPHGAQFLLIGALVGIAITLLELKWRKWVPSATGLGIGMMVPGDVVLSMCIGGLLLTLWTRVNKKQADALGMPLASGLIAGEAIAAIVVPLIVALGLLSASPDPVHAGCGMFGDAVGMIPGCHR